jgi:UDP-glucose 4-epimerase
MVLILGSGFIGRALYTQLKASGRQAKLFSKSLVTDATNHTYGGDLEEIERYEHLFEGVDTVVHAIHTTVPSTSHENELFDVQTNVIPFIRILKICQRRQVKNFIYLSSGGAVYGNPLKQQAITEDHLTDPISSYGVTKLMCEKYLLLHRSGFPGHCVILRPSNVFGEEQNVSRPQGLIGHVLRAVESNTTFHIWGDGRGRKDYLYVGDLIEAIQQVIHKDGRPESGIYNIGSGHSWSVNDIIREVETIYNKKMEVAYHPSKSFDVQEIQLDSALFKERFNWESKKSLHEFLQENKRGKGQAE